MSRSEQLFNEALKHIPGGVNSPVRAFKAVGGNPVFFESAERATLKDVDGKEYIDFVGSWGPMILGHRHPVVVKALEKALKSAVSFGAPCEAEVELAALMKSIVPGLDKVRMVNSGTEACMSAIRLARAYTGKNKIIKFNGCYHGHADSFLIKAGSGVTTLSIPNSPGVPESLASLTLIAEYNDLQSVESLIDSNKDIAAIIIEPVAGNMGCIPPKKGFLDGLRKLCDKHDILLIFDEVMTGFRVAPGGAAELYKIKPDLFTFGKIIGGGLPVGAFGGKEEIMNILAPMGPVYQAGTLSGNPLAMASGLATLNYLNDHPEVYPDLEKKGQLLEERLNNAFRELELPVQINHIGSMISIHFSEYPVTDFASAAGADEKRFAAFFHHMLDNGIYLPPSAYESWFLSIAHDDSMINRVIELARKFKK